MTKQSRLSQRTLRLGHALVLGALVISLPARAWRADTLPTFYEVARGAAQCSSVPEQDPAKKPRSTRLFIERRGNTDPSPLSIPDDADALDCFREPTPSHPATSLVELTKPEYLKIRLLGSPKSPRSPPL